MKASKLFTVVLSAFLLQGCVAAALVGVAGIATKTGTDPRTFGTQVDDTTLEARVANAINANQDLQHKTRIVTTVYQGKVLLTGQAPTSELSGIAKKIAMEVEGAIEVYNEIRLGKPVSLGTTSMDTWITTKIRSKLLTSDSVKSSNVKVTTENGEVFLLGLLTHKEGQSAAKIAASISGVKHVTTALTYVN